MKDVVRDLHDAELACDHAIAAIATFTARLPKARVRAKVAAMVGQGAIDNALAASSLMGQVRARLVESHNQLNDVRAQLGLATVAAGGGYEKPLELVMPTSAANEDIAA
ncbi:hypothetical protein [Sphingomonas azotifigens]|uniref:hypothetical protein n=1 Tax=Sphingomonas azotifigens TaxID=330920 RepID=UPI000A0127F7|nr:hypothetical protein [Sphingomonas azotifigens]